MKMYLSACLLCALVVPPAFAQESSATKPAPLTVPVPPYAVIPADAIASGDLSAATNWIWVHDSGTPGSSTGSSQFPIENPSMDNKSREFDVAYSDRAGERYSLNFGHDSTATHFVYDVRVYVVDPTQLANLEMDINQVIANGKTVTLAFQCSAYSGTWQYGLMSNGGYHWHATTLACNPEKWQANIWHHIRIGTHRNGDNVYYDWVYFDGVYSQLSNANGPGAQSLNWAAADLLLNFQIDGAYAGSGSVKLYQDELMVTRW